MISLKSGFRENDSFVVFDVQYIFMLVPSHLKIDLFLFSYKVSRKNFHYRVIMKF